MSGSRETQPNLDRAKSFLFRSFHLQHPSFVHSSMRWSCALAIAALAAADILSSAVASPVRHEAATNFLEERPRPAAQTRAPFAPLIAHPDAGASIPGEYVVWLHPHAQVAAHGSAESVVATRAITDELLGMMARDAQTDDAVRVLHRYESGFAVRLGVQEDAQVVLDALRSRGDVVAWIEPNQCMLS